MVATAAGYIPDRGDVVWLAFTPQAHEQAGMRPALVLSPANYNAKSGLMLCCPVTNQAKNYPFEVPIQPGGGSQVSGVALADQIRCVDYVARKANKFAWVTAQCVQDVSSKAKTLLP